MNNFSRNVIFRVFIWLLGNSTLKVKIIAWIVVHANLVLEFIVVRENDISRFAGILNSVPIGFFNSSINEKLLSLIFLTRILSFTNSCFVLVLYFLMLHKSCKYIPSHIGIISCFMFFDRLSISIKTFIKAEFSNFIKLWWHAYSFINWV